MDELEVLRKIRRSDATPTDEVLARGQASLERAIAARQTSRGTATAPPRAAGPRRRLRSPRFVLASAAAAVALGAGIAIIGPGFGSPDAQAAVILSEAAERLRTVDAALADSRALRVEEVHETLAEMSIPGGPVDTPGETIKYRDSETFITEIPSDRSADWTVSRSGRSLVEVLDPHGVSNAADVVHEALADSNSTPGADVEIWPGGIPPWSSTDPLWRAAPTNAAELRSYILDDVADQESDTEESIFEWLLPVLSSPAAPAELRAAGFDVLAEFGSISAPNTTERIISMESAGDTSRRDLVFNDEGELTEVRDVLTGESTWLAGIEPGTVLSSIRISSTVVDEASTDKSS